MDVTLKQILSSAARQLKIVSFSSFQEYILNLTVFVTLISSQSYNIILLDPGYNLYFLNDFND